MRKLALLLFGLLALGCDDTELQEFVQERGATRAHVDCTSVDGAPVNYSATLFWDGSVFVRAVGEGQYHPRGSAAVEAREVLTTNVAQASVCHLSGVRRIQIGMRISEDAVEAFTRDNCDSPEEHVTATLSALSSCTGFNLEALEN